MLVAVPLAACVIVAPDEKPDVPVGANQTSFVASPELTIVTPTPPITIDELL